jgi:Peptidase family M23
LDLTTFGMFRPDLAWPAYAGKLPRDGIAPIFNLFDRIGGGVNYKNRVTRVSARDYRGGRLSYDEHDGTDLVCPPGTPVVCAAPGLLVAVRDSWLRGGLTACVDHGEGVVTQYTHLSEVTATIGQPLRRGEVFARSGTTGLDMLSGFPWVPPHIHFMVWICGRPVDPYLARGERLRPGCWLHANDPRTADAPLPDDPAPERLSLAVDTRRVEELVDRCSSRDLREELARVGEVLRGGGDGTLDRLADAARAAILEDSLHHERHAWAPENTAVRLRLSCDSTRVRLTLPLPAVVYRGARPRDAPWTRPANLAYADPPRSKINA